MKQLRNFIFKCNGEIIDSFRGNVTPKQIGDTFTIDRFEENVIQCVTYEVISISEDTFICKKIDTAFSRKY